MLAYVGLDGGLGLEHVVSMLLQPEITLGVVKDSLSKRKTGVN